MPLKRMLGFSASNVISLKYIKFFEGVIYNFNRVFMFGFFFLNSYSGFCCFISLGRIKYE